MARRAKQLREIIFRNMQAPGDVMMMTVAIRDLHRCYPGQFKTAVSTTAQEIWENNPYVQNLNHRRAKTIKLGYPLIHKSNQWGLHFIQGFINDLNKKLSLNVRLTEFRPDFHWSKQEMAEPLVEGPYWIVLSGGKADFTTKWWDVARYQEVVHRLKGKVNFVQIGNKPSGGGARHHHPPLRGVINMVGKTNLRQAFRLCLHARGVLTPITCFMHLAAGIAKPTVVVAGGREHYTWEAYNEETARRNMAYAAGRTPKLPGTPEQYNGWHPSNDKQFVNHPFYPHDYLHTIGQLKCCKNGGCWKLKVTEGRPEQNCSDVIIKPGRVPLPRCLDMITVDAVVEKILAAEQRISQEDYKVPTIDELIVKMPGADQPPPKQEPNPIVEGPKKSEKPKRGGKPGKKKKPVAPVANQGFIPAKQLKFRHLTFPVTVCALTYGDNADLALRCLNGLYNHFDPSLFKLRFAMNEVTPEARQKVLKFLQGKPNVERVYEANPQIYKYPMMQRMFYDPNMPITTDWVMWFDDDSHIVDPQFINVVGKKVDEMFLEQTARYPKGHHCFGKTYYFHFRGNQQEWMEKASWYTGRPPNLDKTKKPPMPKSDFCTGGFWIVTRKALLACDWPDPRIKHRGGDIMLGAALQQQGYGVSQAFRGVEISDAKQRGFNEEIAGTK